MSKLSTIVGVFDPIAVAEASRKVVTQNLHRVVPVKAAQGLGIDEGTAIVGAVVGVVALVLVVRGAMGWYVGKQFGRPYSGAVAGGLLGAPGLGAVALFGKGK